MLNCSIWESTKQTFDKNIAISALNHVLETEEYIIGGDLAMIIPFLSAQTGIQLARRTRRKKQRRLASTLTILASGSRNFLPENRPFQAAEPGIQFFGARNEASSADRTIVVSRRYADSRAKNRRSTSSNSLNTGWLMSRAGAPNRPSSTTSSRGSLREQDSRLARNPLSMSTA